MAVTVTVVLPLTAPETALMVAVPALTAVASPLELIVATAVFDEDHVAVLVRSWVVLSLTAPVAVNCWVLPTWTDGFVGLTETETSTADDAVLLDGLLLPPQAESINASATKKE